MEDILFTDPGTQDLKLALQKKNPREFHVDSFEALMLDTDETEGCLQRKVGKRKLTTPHSVSMLDFDGDCLSDLFLTVVEQNTGKSFYEIYHRRVIDIEQETDEESEGNEKSEGLKGLNRYCLVSREEIPSSTSNLFHFADVDRDGMVDMLLVTKNDLSLHIYYNKLIN